MNFISYERIRLSRLFKEMLLHNCVQKLKKIMHTSNVSPALGNAVAHAPHTAAVYPCQTSFHRLGSPAPGHIVQSKSNKDVSSIKITS